VVVVLSNEMGVDMISPLAKDIAEILLLPVQDQASEQELASIRKILVGLQQGQIDKSLFTSNANFYFTTALSDYKASLGPLGTLKSLARKGEHLRGGMTHRLYHATFDKQSVNLNVYVTSDGKYEQFLVESD